MSPDTYDNYANINISIPMLQNFLTDGYGEDDPENNIDVAANQITWTNASRGVLAGVYKNFLIPFSNFSHAFTYNNTHRSSKYNSFHMCWGVSNGYHTLQEIIQSGGIALFIWNDASDQYVFRLSQYQPSLSDVSTTLPVAINAEYTFNINRVGNTITCLINGPSGYTDTLILAGINPITYSTITTYGSYNNASIAATSSGYIKNLYI